MLHSVSVRKSLGDQHCCMQLGEINSVGSTTDLTN